MAASPCDIRRSICKRSAGNISYSCASAILCRQEHLRSEASMCLFRDKFLFGFLLIMVSGLLELLFAQNSYAQLRLKQVKTPEGMLAVRAGKGSDCYECEG